MSTSDADRLRQCLTGMIAAQASDLHLVPGYRPMYRIHGELTPAAETTVTPEAVTDLLDEVAPPPLRDRIHAETDVDFAVQLDTGGGLHRFRVNAFAARGQRGVCFRAVPEQIPTLTELNFPQDLGERIVQLNNGLVLITGLTGSGKTSTLAALIHLLNTAGGYRIITIEEPIEYIHQPISSSVVSQREVGADVPTFYDGLRSGLRQDPDVLLVGEIRDQETAQLALTAAETGHLIFATLHTIDAKGAITRMVDLFPAARHDEIRRQMAMSLRYVVAQHLLPSSEGGRRILATEVLRATFAVNSGIRQGRIELLESAMQSGAREGMHTLDADLARLVQHGRITIETARQYAKDPSEFGMPG